jgi:hypothetical protein
LRVPQFGGDEQVLAPGLAGVEEVLDGDTDHFFVAIAFCTIEMAKAGFQCVLDRLGRHAQVPEQRAEANRRYRAGAVGKWKSGFAKCIENGFVGHLFSPSRGTRRAGGSGCSCK